MIDYVDSIEIGPGLEDSDMGSQASERELQSTLEYVETAKREGTTLAYDGQPDGEAYESGYFVEPTIFTDADSYII